MTSQAEAKRKYVSKTTAARWEAGMAAGKQNWGKGVASFYGVAPGPKTQANYDAGVSGKGAKYESNTNNKAYDKLFNKARQGIQQ